MTIGVRDYLGQVNMTDTAELEAYLRINEQPVTADQILRVNFMVQKPDDSTQTVLGLVQPDGSGFYRWTDTTQTGEYLVQAQFTLGSGEIRSVMTNFTVIDPFNPPAPNDTDMIVEQVQMRLEDIFDSVEGGPWLRDQTLAQFDYQKIADFIQEALLDINVEMPPTQFGIDFFTTPSVDGDGNSTPNPNMPLLVKGVLVLVIRHLSRSYIEQPTPQNGQVLWEDRTQYSQKWQAQYQIEYADFIQKLRLWKRTLYRFGHSALLVFNKAGRLGYPYSNSAARGVWRGYN
jgi:hypothetical protein